MKFAIAVLILAALAWPANAQCPTITSRAGWGARPARNSEKLSTYPATWYVIHHSAGAACSTKDACAQQVRNIQNLHMDTNGWADIGYNFLVGGDGSIFTGRGWGIVGAHAPGYNFNSHGICFIGTFTSALPTAIARTNTQSLIRCGVSLGHEVSNYSLIGHRQAVATECPGNALYNEIRTWPNFKP